MQAFRAATTVDDDKELRLSDLPFDPGTVVDVIILKHGGQGGVSVSDKKQELRRLPEQQYRLAARYPNEYVVLVGERIVHHGADRRQAAQAYQRIALDDPSSRPVIVSPGEQPRKPLLVRRHLT